MLKKFLDIFKDTPKRDMLIDHIIYYVLYPLFIIKSKLIYINSESITFATCYDVYNIYYQSRVNKLHKYLMILILYIFNLRVFNTNITQLVNKTKTIFYHDVTQINYEYYMDITSCYSKSIQTIYINTKSVIEIKMNAFMNCSSLQNVIFY